jgi:hypothetical protein
MTIFHMKEEYAAIPDYNHKSPTFEGSVNMAQCDSDWMRKMNEGTCQAKWLQCLTKKHEKVVHISLQNQEVLLCIIKLIRKPTPCGYTQMITRATFEEEICSNAEFATLEVPAFLKKHSIWVCKWITRATFNEKTVALHNLAHWNCHHLWNISEFGHAQMILRPGLQSENCSIAEFATSEVLLCIIISGKSLHLGMQMNTKAAFDEKSVALQNLPNQKFFSA